MFHFTGLASVQLFVLNYKLKKGLSRFVAPLYVYWQLDSSITTISTQSLI